MRKPEQRLWDSTRNALGKRLALQRIENVAGTGMPDVVALGSHPSMLNGSLVGTTTFVELKAQEAPPVLASTPILGAKKGLSLAQRNWHTDWAKRGGNSVILIGVGMGQKRKLFCIPSTFADEVNGMTLAELAINSVACSWAELAVRLGAGE